MLRFAGHSLGDVDAFALEQDEAPTPGQGEVRIKVKAVALGYVDALIMRGLYQLKPPLPFVPGGEIVGTIDACGNRVEGWAVGQRVATWQFGGGLAHYVTCRADDCVQVPDTIPDAACAALILDYLTAYYGLFDRGHLRPGHSILILGAAGGVGHAATRLAAMGGAFVAGASQPAKREFVESLGAVVTLDTREDGWRDVLKRHFPDGIDRVFDPVGGAAFEPAFRALGKRGCYLIVGFAAEQGIPKLPVHLPLLKSAELKGVDARYLAESDRPRTNWILQRVFAMAALGMIKPQIAREFPLEQTADAFALLADRSRVGKCVVRPDLGQAPRPLTIAP